MLFKTFFTSNSIEYLFQISKKNISLFFQLEKNLKLFNYFFKEITKKFAKRKKSEKNERFRKNNNRNGNKR